MERDYNLEKRKYVIGGTVEEKEQKNQNARAVKCKDQDNKTHQENSQQEGI